MLDDQQLRSEGEGAAVSDLWRRDCYYGEGYKSREGPKVNQWARFKNPLPCDDLSLISISRI